jgi:hypothetical protein
MKLLSIFLLALSLAGMDAYTQTDTDAVKISIGTADEFGVLAGSGVTNISAHTLIIGDVGSSPTPTIVGLTPSQVKGHLYLKASPVTAKAQKGLTAGYIEAQNAPCGTDLTGKDLGGMKLGPGVYCFSTSAGLTGTLTLDAHGNPDAQWVFQIGSTLITASGSKVAMVLGHKLPWAKGERGCNVYWQVGTSATIGGGSLFVGQILALDSITLGGGTLRGKALARNEAVTISTQETVDGPPCD